jgi:acetyl-CoA C-acetyltransferase
LQKKVCDHNYTTLANEQGPARPTLALLGGAVCVSPRLCGPRRPRRRRRAAARPVATAPRPMPADPETVPVIVGVARYTQPRSTPLYAALSPVGLMARVAQSAEDDAGVPHLLQSVDAVACVESATRNRARLPFPTGLGTDLYANMPRSLADAVGASPPDQGCLLTHDGGNSAQMLINLMADRIAARELSSCLLAGCEDLASVMGAIKQGEHAAAALAARWADTRRTPETTAKPLRVGPQYIETPIEKLHGLHVPVRVYPMLENALRGQLGSSVPEHMSRQARMFSGFSQVAAADPEHSWFPTAHAPEDMADPTSHGNRWVAFPYTKYMCAVMNVDQAAAVLMMSRAEAQRRGVAADRLLYLHGCADTVEKSILQRPHLHRSPAMAEMGRQLVSHANVMLSSIEFKDIYSCFPVAVSVVANELGFESNDGTRLTCTGGLPYHGGPGSNYSMHGVVAMAAKLRDNPTSFGLVTANGGFLSKHAACVYSCMPYDDTHPHAASWSRPDPSTYQQVLDAGAEEAVNEHPCDAVGHVETYTVVHDARGMKRSMVIGKLDATGERFVAISEDVRVMQQMMEQEMLGAKVLVDTDERGRGKFELIEEGVPSAAARL